MLTTKKREPRKPISKSKEPNLSIGEAEALYVALTMERERYKGVPSDNRTPDMETRESALNRLWVRIFTMKFQPPRKSSGDEQLLTELEWKMVVIAARLEMDRLSELPRVLWTPGHLDLERGQMKVTKVLFPITG